MSEGFTIYNCIIIPSSAPYVNFFLRLDSLGSSSDSQPYRHQLHHLLSLFDIPSSGL